MQPSTPAKPNGDAQWSTQGEHPTRGLVDDVLCVDEISSVIRPATTKVLDLNRMLKLISSQCSHYLEVDIIRDSTCIDDVWKFVRAYHNFEQSEGHLIDFYDIKREDGERPQRLYRRLRAHIANNLLVKGSELEHNGKKVERDEDFGWTTERLIVLHWLYLLHPALPKYVKRVYASDLQKKTLKDLQPALCQAVDFMIEEIDAQESRVNYSKSTTTSRGRGRSVNRGAPRFPFSQSSKKMGQPIVGEPCQLCRAERRPCYDHDLAHCDYLSNAQKRSMVRAYGAEISEDLDNLQLVDSDDTHQE